MPMTTTEIEEKLHFLTGAVGVLKLLAIELITALPKDRTEEIQGALARYANALEVAAAGAIPANAERSVEGNATTAREIIAMLDKPPFRDFPRNWSINIGES